MHVILIQTKQLKDSDISDYAIVGNKNDFIKKHKEFIPEDERSYN